jgi:branched-chain amino acid transport system substrate-binding protein
MKKMIWLVVVVVVLVGGVFWMKGEKSESKVIKIGANLELTGPAAQYGMNAKKGIELALEEYNSKNHNKVEVVYEDNRSEAKQTVSGYQKLVSLDKVSAIIGPLFQTSAGALLPVVKKDNTPTVMISPVPLQDRGNFKNPLIVWMDPSEEASQLARYVYESGIRKVGIIGTSDSWDNEVSNAFEIKFKSLGGQVTLKEILLPDAKDTRTSVTKVLNTKPEAVYVGNYLQFIPVVKDLSILGFKGRLFGIEVDTYLATETKPYSNGLQFISPNFYSNDFVAKFKAKYNEEPIIPSGHAYDAMNTLLSFIVQGKTKEGILDQMEKFTGNDGVSGKMTITNNNKTLFPTSVFEVRDGKSIKLIELK